jgi:hypothetical protein
VKWVLLVLFVVTVAGRLAFVVATPDSSALARTLVVPPQTAQLPAPLARDETQLLPGQLLDLDNDDLGTAVDLEGDEVTEALAKYRTDADGNLYELHAPHTEVARLGSPEG